MKSLGEVFGSPGIGHTTYQGRSLLQWPGFDCGLSSLLHVIRPPLSLSCHSLCCDYLILKKQTCPRKSKKRKEKKKYLVGRKACIHSRAPVRLTLTWLGTINRTVWFLVLCDISTAMFSNRGCLHHMVPKSTWLN